MKIDGHVQADAISERATQRLQGVGDDTTSEPEAALSAIKSDIEAALKRRAKADAQNISVEVRDGHVTLTGSVHSWSRRELAWHAAWSTPGVRNVDDQITVDY